MGRLKTVGTRPTATAAMPKLKFPRHLNESSATMKGKADRVRRAASLSALAERRYRRLVSMGQLKTVGTRPTATAAIPKLKFPRHSNQSSATMPG
jgi:hypothetical protein